VIVGAAPQQHLREARRVAGGGEEPGVRRHTAEREGVLVVHLAAQHAAAPRVVLGRRDARELVRPRGQRTIEGVLHAERREDAAAHESVERLTGHPLQDLAQQDDAEIAVFLGAAGRRHQRHGLDALEVGARPLDLLVERRPPVDARGMG